MGMNFELINNYLTGLEISGDLLEIGTDRGEGSTKILGNIAKASGKVLHSVDVDIDIISNQVNLNKSNGLPIQFYNEKGEDFLETHSYLKFSVVLLDNFDWNWKPAAPPDWITNQISYYKSKYNMTMNNTNSQIAHLKQAIRLTNLLTKNSLIVCDDTFPSGNFTYDGKCGAAVPYLISCGFEVLPTPDINVGILLIR